MLEGPVGQEGSHELPLLGLRQQHRARLQACSQAGVVQELRRERVIREDRGLFTLGQAQPRGGLPHPAGQLLRRLVGERQTQDARRPFAGMRGLEAAGLHHGQVYDPCRDDRGLARARARDHGARRERMRDLLPLLHRGDPAAEGLDDLRRSVPIGPLLRANGARRHHGTPSARTCAAATGGSRPSPHRGQMVLNEQNWQSASGLGAKRSSRIRSTRSRIVVSARSS